MLEFTWSGGLIKAKTAWNADSLRGDFADLLLLEEFAYMDPDAWTEVGAPMLLDNDGEAWFMSSPNRRNHFYHLYLKAKSDPRWAAWNASSFANPHLSRLALEKMKGDMSEDAYKQEILGEFLEDSGAVFKDVRKSLYRPPAEFVLPSAHKGHVIVIGADLGKISDYTVFSVGCATCKRELVLYRSNKKRYLYQADRLEAFRDRWRPESTVVERNSMGEPFIEEMRERDVDITPFTTTLQSKQRIIESLVLSMEKGEWKFLDDEQGRMELESYESTMTKMGRISYGAPSGLHDDTVMARAMMQFRARNLVA